MKVAVIGTGMMGAGIAQVFAQNRETSMVCLIGRTEHSAAKGKAKIEKALSRLVKKDKITPERADDILAKIITGKMDIAADCDVIVETIIEDIQVKKETFLEMDEIVKAGAVFATNTSSLSITEIGAGLKHPVVGMHFFNPAPVMKLVEVTAGLNTPEKAVNTIIEIAEAIGKTPVRVNEAPGFVVNRILIPMINEAIIIYSEGTASAEDIDIAMKLGANHPMGPLALGDLIGLDVVLAIMEVLHKETGENKYRPASLLRKMVRGNRLGRKTGEGFYKYE